MEWVQLVTTIIASSGGAAISVMVSYMNLRERLIRLEAKVEPLTINGVTSRVEVLEQKVAIHEAVKKAIDES